ncbi:hypothetical protein VaNZ11_016698 [Volvox africanus]|uniref:Vacuolar sorting receptor thioredoxin-like domain-containing protein n=1 Tax=Volvox africanus TaxID=51714 RepID=A0ABQ5SPC8_9CHLO|nr:hypothetical protein VaNZ11_016698 [Volvox africanus]
MAMRWECFLLGMLAVAVCKHTVATLVTEGVELKVIWPNPRTINMAMANFGVPKYGGTLRGNLVYFSDEARYYKNTSYRCHPRDCRYGCDLHTSSPPIKIDKEPGTAYIMMVDRGPRDSDKVDACYFLDKVYNAQLLGADMVLVADDKEEALTTAVAPDTNDTAIERRNLTASAAMIGKNDADFLREQLGDGKTVLVMVSWAKSIPESNLVSWEYWTGTTDSCGNVCSERVEFTKAIYKQAMKLEQLSLTAFTPRYFLYDCKEGTVNTPECQSNCFSNGRYCAEPSGDYTGKDVLRMNIRAKCLYRQAKAKLNGYVWWEYMARFFEACSMSRGQYNAECAGTVFDTLAKEYDIGTRTEWDQCATGVNETAPTIEILEDDLISQLGNATSPPLAPVLILPTIRINGGQYRGSLEASPVLRALCAAFPDGHEPAVCNEIWVSDDECQGPHGEGYIKCNVGNSNGMTGCINTFKGYQCTCGSGFQMIMNPEAYFEETCKDINECAVSTTPYRESACRCDRCACINNIGSYKCTGPRENQCTPENNYGGCWHGTYENVTFTNCIDTIAEYKQKSYMGILQDNDTWHKCGECPKCFRSISLGCEYLCSPSQVCDVMYNTCIDQQSGGERTPNGGKAPSASVGVHPGLMILVALGAAALTGGVVMATNHIMMKKRMADEIRDIMSSYMPLQEEHARNPPSAAGQGPSSGNRGGYQERIIRPDEDSDEEGRVGAYGWSTGQPAAASAVLKAGAGAVPTLMGASQRAAWAPPTSATAGTAPVPGAGPMFSSPSPSAAAAAPLKPIAPKPTVDAFGGAEDERPQSMAPPAGDADPLLGRQVASSSSSVQKSSGEENPFR